MTMLYRFWKENGKTVIMVTHDMHLAKYAQRHIELKDGKIIRDETNQDQLCPEY